MAVAACLMAKAFRQPISSIRLWRNLFLRYGVFSPCEISFQLACSRFRYDFSNGFLHFLRHILQLRRIE